MGKAERTAESYQRQLEWLREYKRKRRKDAAFRLKEARAENARYHANKDQHRAEARERYEERKNEINKRRRERRRANPEATRAQDSKWYRASFKHCIAELRRGRITVDELHQRLRKSFIWADERLESARRSYADDGRRASEAASELGKGEA